jgi:hypothetical protein
MADKRDPNLGVHAPKVSLSECDDVDVIEGRHQRPDDRVDSRGFVGQANVRAGRYLRRLGNGWSSRRIGRGGRQRDGGSAND